MLAIVSFLNWFFSGYACFGGCFARGILLVLWVFGLGRGEGKDGDWVGIVEEGGDRAYYEERGS